MKIGLIARAGNTGLGTLSLEFARHLKPVKTLIVTNGVEQTFPERFENSRRARQTFTILQDEMQWLTEGVDVILSFETFYNWQIVSFARKRGVKTALLTMAELFPEKLPATPDLFNCPSKLDMDIVPDPKVFLEIPIATDRLHWKQRDRANVFIHSGSHGGMSGRKGTGLLLEAMNYVKSDIQMLIYTWGDFECTDPRVQIHRTNFKNYWQLWREGDVLVYPQGANGICLPIIEAMSSGLAVITTDEYPFNEYMPKELLVKPERFVKVRMGGNFREVDDPLITPQAIAEKIDEIAGEDISSFSLYGKKFAKDNSWDKWLPMYRNVFEKL